MMTEMEIQALKTVASMLDGTARELVEKAACELEARAAVETPDERVFRRARDLEAAVEILHVAGTAEKPKAEALRDRAMAAFDKAWAELP